MPSKILINKLAKLAVKVGANVQKDQLVIVRATTETKEIVREVVKEAYLAGANYCHIICTSMFFCHFQRDRS